MKYLIVILFLLGCGAGALATEPSTYRVVENCPTLQELRFLEDCEKIKIGCDAKGENCSYVTVCLNAGPNVLPEKEPPILFTVEPFEPSYDNSDCNPTTCYKSGIVYN